jgi:mRNA interferase MazF
MRRGDVYLANLDPTRGSEQAGRRPVLVLQRDALNSILRTVVVAPFTSNTKRAGAPTCHLVPAGEGGLTVDSLLLCHQIRVLDSSRLATRMGTISKPVLDAIARKLSYTLAL